VNRLFSPWRWTRTHRSSGGVEGWVCADCPHSRVFGRSSLSASPVVARQPYSDPAILGGGRRPSCLRGTGQGVFRAVGCRVHPSGCPSVRPSRLVRVRGDPPSMFIPRPYMRLPGREHSPPRGLNDVSLFSPRLEDTQEALNYLLRNVGKCFTRTNVVWVNLMRGMDISRVGSNFTVLVT